MELESNIPSLDSPKVCSCCQSRKCPRLNGIFCASRGHIACTVLLVTMILVGVGLAVYYGFIYVYLTGDGEANNVVIYYDVAFVAIAGDGMLITNVTSEQILATVPPPPGSERIDDLSVDISAQLLFVLDAWNGYLSVFKLPPPVNQTVKLSPSNYLPTVANTARGVPSNPYCGVSAANGFVVVSGGRDDLTVYTYDSAGKLNTDRSGLNLARGQPDVLISTDGIAYVSTHFFDETFGIATLRLNTPPAAPTFLNRVFIDGAGFSEGGTIDVVIVMFISNQTVFVCLSACL